jgi:hypothetical protein
MANYPATKLKRLSVIKHQRVSRWKRSLEE